MSGGGDLLFYREIGEVIDAIHERGLVSFVTQWTGGKFDRLRHEMREVMLAAGEAEYQDGKYETLARVKARHPRLRRAYERIAAWSPRFRTFVKRHFAVR